MRRVILFGLVVCIVLSFAACSFAGTDNNEIRATVVTNSGETKEMTLQEIKDVEESNSILFEEEYVGADITVTSTVKKVGGSYTLTSWFDCDAYVELDSGSNIACFFHPITREQAKTVSVGDTMTAKGKIGMATVAGFDVYILKTAIQPY